MKKLWKMMLAAMLMSLAVCLFAGTAVSAETVSGEICDGFTWSYDTETRTLTLKGEGEIPAGAVSSPSPWEDYREDIQYIYLDGITSSGSVYGRYNRDKVQAISGRFGTDFTWELDLVSLTLNVDGSGKMEDTPWAELYDDGDLGSERNLKNYVIGDGITSMCESGYYTNTVTIGKSCSNYIYVATIIVSPDNPYFSSYDGAIYTKGYEKLLCYPYWNPHELHPDVKIIGKESMISRLKGTIVLPWGVTTIEPYAFVVTGGGKPTIVLPDTITSMQQTNAGGKDCEVLFVYSRSNDVVQRAIGNATDSFGYPIANPVDSVAEYYPDHYAQTPEASEPSSEPSAPTSSGSSDAKPVDKPSGGASSSQPQPPSQPAESSQPSSQTASRPASSSQPESSAPESSARPAESSAPSAEASEPSAQESSEAAFSVPESSETESSSPESSPESSDEFYEDMMSRSETPEQAGGSLSWILPLVIVLGAAAAVAAVILVLVLRKK